MPCPARAHREEAGLIADAAAGERPSHRAFQAEVLAGCCRDRVPADKALDGVGAEPLVNLGVSGTGYCANETVNLSLQSFSLGSTQTDSAGSFSTTVALPAGVTGPNTVVGTGASCGDRASADITIGGLGAGGGSGGGPGGGGLSATGVAVIGIGSLGLVLLAGGSLLLLAGRRRRVSV